MILAMGEGLGCRLMMDSRYTLENGLEVMFDMLNRGISSQEQSGPGMSSGDVIDINGVKTRVRDICFGKTRSLPAKSGLAEVQIDPQKVAEIKIMKNGSSFQAEITTKEGDSEIAEGKYKVIVKIVDQNGKPIAGAKVVLFSGPQEKTTNKDGLVKFDEVGPGSTD